MPVPDNDSQKPKVLLIEDDQFLVRTYQVAFHREGIEAVAVFDGKSALERLSKDPTDAVILDLMLPLVSGFDVLQAIRANPKWKDVPVLVLTNLAQPQDKEHAQKLGAQEYMVKATVHIADVLKKVKEVLKLPSKS